MYRLAEKDLLEWIGKKRRKPLVIRGARQVGKSTLVRNFARKQDIPLAEINLEKHLFLNEAFKTFDIDYIIRELESLTSCDIDKKSLLFLDEIQACPAALPCLRYFYEEKKDIPVISAGSLLEFVLSEHNFSMPVGRVEYFHLGPMLFKEFLMALNEEKLLSYLDRFSFQNVIPLGAHQKLSLLLRQYFFIGGMPESVLAYKETNSMKEVRAIHRSIIETYQDDFGKYAKKSHWLRLSRIIRKLPQNLGQKVKYTNISAEDRSQNIKEALDILIKAKILLPVYHSSCSGLPLSATVKEKVFKIYFLDIGLFNYLCNLDWKIISGSTEDELVNSGVLAEQFIAQHLFYREKGIEPPMLNYWLRETVSSNAEVDFVISMTADILPIEVKAGKSGSLKSILKFVHEKNTRQALRFDLNQGGIQQVKHLLRLKEGTTKIEYSLVSLPLYLVENIGQILGE